MTILNNEILINAPIEKIWRALSEVDNLEKYDPTVKKVILLSDSNSGVGTKRKVEMKDGKNWFEETCTEFQLNKSLAFELSACSFPVQNLQHSYSLEELDSKIKVKHKMIYNIKYGVVGKLMDALIIRKQSNKGIKLFMEGLKVFVEK